MSKTLSVRHVRKLIMKQKIMEYMENTCSGGAGKTLYDICEYGLGGYHKNRDLASTALHYLKTQGRLFNYDRVWYLVEKNEGKKERPRE